MGLEFIFVSARRSWWQINDLKKGVEDLAPHRLQLKMWLSFFSGNEGVEGRVAWEDLKYKNKSNHYQLLKDE